MNKKIIFLSLTLLSATSQALQAQNVGINATGNTPAPTAMLDIEATNKSLLIPRIALTNNTDAIRWLWAQMRSTITRPDIAMWLLVPMR